ncbi:MAG: hypothetical protein Tsb005_20200 [Gammaproteobacteria bacterium]
MATMTLRVSDAHKRKLENMAEKIGSTPAQLVRKFIHDALEQHPLHQALDTQHIPIRSDRIAEKQLKFLLEIRFLLRHLVAKTDPQLLAECVEKAEEGLGILLKNAVEQIHSFK